MGLCICCCEELQTDRNHLQTRSNQTPLRCVRVRHTVRVCVALGDPSMHMCCSVAHMHVQHNQLSPAINSLLSDLTDLNEWASLPWMLNPSLRRVEVQKLRHPGGSYREIFTARLRKGGGGRRKVTQWDRHTESVYVCETCVKSYLFERLHPTISALLLFIRSCHPVSQLASARVSNPQLVIDSISADKIIWLTPNHIRVLLKKRESDNTLFHGRCCS